MNWKKQNILLQTGLNLLTEKGFIMVTDDMFRLIEEVIRKHYMKARVEDLKEGKKGGQ